MSGVFSFLQGALNALNSVYQWANEQCVKCYQACARIFASIWERFVDFISNLTEFVKNQLSKIRFLFCSSNETTRLSRTTSQDGLTQEIEIQQRNVQLDVRYNHDGKEQVPKTQGERSLKSKKKQAVEEVKNFKNGMNKVLDNVVKYMEDDIEADDPAEKAQRAQKIKQLLDADETKKFIKEMGIVPKLIA